MESDQDMRDLNEMAKNLAGLVGHTQLFETDEDIRNCFHRAVRDLVAIVDDANLLTNKDDMQEFLYKIQYELNNLFYGLKPIATKIDRKIFLYGFAEIFACLANTGKQIESGKNININLDKIEKSLEGLVKNTEPKAVFSKEVKNTIDEYEKLRKNLSP